MKDPSHYLRSARNNNRERGRSGRNTTSKKSKCPRNQEWAKAHQHRKMKGKIKWEPIRGRRGIHSRPKIRRSRLRQRKRPQQVPIPRKQGEARDQACRLEDRARK
jgi:hypothetical protein